MAPISWIGIRHPFYQLQLHHFYLSPAFPLGRVGVGNDKWAKETSISKPREIPACRETKEWTPPLVKGSQELSSSYEGH